MRKIIKSANSDATQTFRLHYFPAIPAEGGGAPAVACGGGAFRNLEAAGASLPLGQAAPRGETGLQAEKDAGARLAEIERQAYQEGFARGERDARAAGQRQLEPILAGLQQLLGSLDAGRQKLRRKAEQEIVALALAVARKIVGQELRTNETALARIVREAIGRTGVAGPIRVRLHPDDLQRMQSAPEGIAALPAEGGQVHFEADSAISGGGCLVETEWGQIDARVEEQFRVIEEAFRAEMMPSGDQEAERP